MALDYPIGNIKCKTNEFKDIKEIKAKILTREEGNIFNC